MTERRKKEIDEYIERFLFKGGKIKKIKDFKEFTAEEILNSVTLRPSKARRRRPRKASGVYIFDKENKDE